MNCPLTLIVVIFCHCYDADCDALVTIQALEIFGVIYKIYRKQKKMVFVV